MCDENTLEILERLLEVQTSDEYEYGRSQAIGGTTGLYKFRTPYNTECEYSVLSASATGNGSFLVTTNPSPNGPVTTGTQSYGMATNGGESNYIDGTFVALGANTTYVPGISWQPLPSPGDVYALITSAANQSVFVNVIFRRRLERAIPQPPRVISPHMPKLLRPNRRTFREGIQQAIYPNPDGYVHPVGVIPVPSQPDTLWGGSNYGEASTSLAPKTLSSNPKLARRAYRTGRTQ